MASEAAALVGAVGMLMAWCIGLLVAFSIARILPLTKKFCQPRRYATSNRPPKPRRISNKPLAWLCAAASAPSEALVRHASTDAALYGLLVRLGLELFVGVSLITFLIVLPVNATGGEVARQRAAAATSSTSPWTYWLPSPTPEVTPDGSTMSLDSAPPSFIQAPRFYEGDLPPVPPGLEWWEYRDSVPLLPTPAEALGPNYTRFGWRYKQDYQAVTNPRFSPLDLATTANLPAGSPRFFAHAVAGWLVTLLALRLLWRFQQAALRLRLQHLTTAPRGTASHTVLLRDIPGIDFGTIAHRTDSTLLCFLPRAVKRWLAGAALTSVKGLHEGVAATAGLAAKGAKGAASLLTPGASRPGAAQPGQSGGEGKATAACPGACAGAPDGTLLASTSPSSAPRELEDPWLAMEARLEEGMSVEAAVEAELRALFGADLAGVHLVRDTSSLDPLVKEYQATLRSAADLVDSLVARRRRGKRVAAPKLAVVGPRYGRWGVERYGPQPVRVDALRFYRDRLLELWRRIGEEQTAAATRPTPTAFVSFTTRRAATVAASGTLLCHDSSCWRMGPAPSAEEVVWGNVCWRAWERSGRSLLMWAAFAALTIFFMVPVSAVQALLNSNGATSWLRPAVASLASAILPGLALRVFLALLPLVLTTLMRFSGTASQSAIDLGVASRYFFFQVITVFMGSFVAGSISSQLMRLLRNPQAILDVLGSAAPSAARFFLSYLLLQALVAKPMGLLRPVGLGLYVLRSLLCATERAKARLSAPPALIFGQCIPDASMTILLGLVFCLICPPIALVALASFCLELVLAKYKMLYVLQPTYESGGRASLLIFNQATLGLLLFQLTTIALLGAKRCPLPAVLLAPSLPVTALFWWVSRQLFARSQRSLSLKDAARLDAEEASIAEATTGSAGGDSIPAHRPGAAATELAPAAAAAAASASAYLSPSFTLEERELVEALCELDATSHCLKGGGGGGGPEAGLEGQPSLRSDAFASAVSEEGQMQGRLHGAISSAWLSAESFSMRRRRTSSSSQGPSGDGGGADGGADGGAVLVVERSRLSSLVVVVSNPLAEDEKEGRGKPLGDSSSSGQEGSAAEAGRGGGA